MGSRWFVCIQPGEALRDANWGSVESDVWSEEKSLKVSGRMQMPSISGRELSQTERREFGEFHRRHRRLNTDVNGAAAFDGWQRERHNKQWH